MTRLFPAVFVALARAADTVSARRRAAMGTAPGSPKRVAHADAVTAVDDLRIAYGLKYGRTPDQMDRNGYLTPAGLAAYRAQRAAEPAPS